MKRITAIGILICLIITHCACEKSKKDLVNTSTLDAGEYQAIVWNDKTYVSYCAINNEERGELFGIVN